MFQNDGFKIIFSHEFFSWTKQKIAMNKVSVVSIISSKTVVHTIYATSQATCSLRCAGSIYVPSGIRSHVYI